MTQTRIVRGKVYATWPGGFSLTTGDNHYRIRTDVASPWGIGAMPPAMELRRREGGKTWRITWLADGGDDL